MPVLRWPGATARYSHFRVPVETGTPPRRRSKVRSAPFPPDGENCARSLAPPLQTEPACAGLRSDRFWFSSRIMQASDSVHCSFVLPFYFEKVHKFTLLPLCCLLAISCLHSLFSFQGTDLWSKTRLKCSDSCPNTSIFPWWRLPDSNR